MVKVKYDKQKQEWIHLPKFSKEGFYLDGFIVDSYGSAKKVMKRKDVDLPTVVTGYPGSGKSTFVIQAATFCDHTFNHKRMCQSAEDFIEGIKTAKVGEAWVLDESYKDLNSSEVRRETGRALLNVMNIIRQKRLYIFIVLPNFFDLHKSIAIFRTRWLIHCYDKSFGDIGYFAAFDRPTKHSLYIKGKRDESYDIVPSDGNGKFTKQVPETFDWEAYTQMKEKGLQEVFVSTQEDRTSIVQRNILIYHLYKAHDYTTKKLSEISGVSIRHTQDIVKKEKKKDEFKSDPDN